MPTQPSHRQSVIRDGSARSGKQKLEGLTRGQLGAVYTPPELAKWAADLLFRYLGASKKNFFIADPAVGDGALLKALHDTSPHSSLVGIDIDARAILQGKTKLGKSVRLIRADALVPTPEKSVVKAWKDLLGGKKLNGIIANPPWGGVLTHEPQVLRDRGYSLARGQFDSFELFIELAITTLSSDGVAVFIIPDSIFQPEHQPLREMLLAKTSLLMIARLGEGFFDGVCRGAAVVVFRKKAATANHKVACMRLNKFWRDKVLQGMASLAQAEDELVHQIPQGRFAKDVGKRFDIDLTKEEGARISVIEQHINGWSSWLDSTRGVELSKGGKVFLCPKCGAARPAPRGVDQWQCFSCGAISKAVASKQESIVFPASAARKGWRPFIVGEDVDRYHVVPSRCIKANVPGINYKDEDIFEGKKLVIRKTGVGIKAAIDISGAYTNQVVFIFKPSKTKKPPEFVLEYFQGVLCSRVMLAYYLKKKGDNEWRSHPYLTQKIISELPVPDIHEEDGWRMNQIRAIADAVHKYTLSPTVAADCKVERLVAGLFGLTASDCQWVMNVLNSSQGLEPIRTLRLSDSVSFEPERV